MSAPVDVGVGSIGLVLPADWVVGGRVVARLVDEQVGDDESHEELRRELRVALNAGARRAAASGGWLLAPMLTRAGGRPIPATLTAYRAAGSFRDEAGVEAVRAALAATTKAAGGRLEVGSGPFGVLLRAVRERTAGGDLPRLACDYWTDPLDDHGLVHLSFSTPFVALRDEWCALVDTVVATLHRPGLSPGDKGQDATHGEHVGQDAAAAGPGTSDRQAPATSAGL